MKRRVFVGIDTSNYTTSVGIVAEDGELVANLKRPLPVSEGERGLRQSEAVFAHIKNLPDIMAEAESILSGCEVLAVGVSERPRNVEGSYMPCFLAGVSAARSLVAPIGVPLYAFSHQCGHLMAATYSSGAPVFYGERFGALHISGGTTELLRASLSDSGFDATLVGGTLDLNAGQVIDRIGVALGLRFPAGPELEKLALGYEGKIYKRKPSVNGMTLNLSGAENISLSLYRKTGDRAAVAAFVFSYIGEAITGICRAYKDKFGENRFLFAGGVMCNSLIKSRITREGFESYFAEPALSSDNAVGIAVLAKNKYTGERK